MTATPITAGEDLDHARNAEFRLSARQREMLTTLNTLFEELSPAMVAEDDIPATPEFDFEPVNVSRVDRD